MAKNGILEQLKKPQAAKSAAPAAAFVAPVDSVAVAPAAVVEPVAVNWDELELSPAEVSTYTRNTTARKSVAETTPQVIKDRIEAGFSASDASAKPVWLVQSFPSATVAAEFLKLAKRYAKFQQWTLRAGFENDEATVLRFCVKVRETRAPRPKSPEVVAS